MLCPDCGTEMVFKHWKWLCENPNCDIIEVRMNGFEHYKIIRQAMSKKPTELVEHPHSLESAWQKRRGEAVTCPSQP